MKKLKFTQSFTLIELIAVMIIIMIIAGLIVGVGSSARKRALETRAESMIAALEVAIGMYHTDTGEYPPDDDDTPPPDTNSPSAILYDRLTNTEYNDGLGDPDDINGWKGPYMEFKDKDINTNEEIVDPWKNRYIYEEDPAQGNTESFNLWSWGANGINNSANPDGDCGDDITNWK